MIDITVDASGAIKFAEDLEKYLTEVQTIGRILQYATSVIWIPNIKTRLFKSTSKTFYQGELGQTMRQLDPDFVDRLGGGNWADVTEAERRGYNKGEITEAISQAIKAEIADATKGHIAVGVGDLDILNSISAGVANSEVGHSIWQILNYGTGMFVPGGSSIIRYGKQVFFNRTLDTGVLAWKTENPGFRGREYFVQLDNTFHESDYLTRDYVIRYMANIVKRLSYGGKGV